jgi:hypothetical protein
MELGYNQDGPTPIQQDNSGAITIYKQAWSYSNKSRHIRTKYLYVVEQMGEGVISITPTPTDKMISDGLTKPITGKAFKESREMIGVKGDTSRSSQRNGGMSQPSTQLSFGR